MIGCITNIDAKTKSRPIYAPTFNDPRVGRSRYPAPTRGHVAKSVLELMRKGSHIVCGPLVDLISLSVVWTRDTAAIPLEICIKHNNIASIFHFVLNTFVLLVLSRYKTVSDLFPCILQDETGLMFFFSSPPIPRSPSGRRQDIPSGGSGPCRLSSLRTAQNALSWTCRPILSRRHSPWRWKYVQGLASGQVLPFASKTPRSLVPGPRATMSNSTSLRSPPSRTCPHQRPTSENSSGAAPMSFIRRSICLQIFLECGPDITVEPGLDLIQYLLFVPTPRPRRRSGTRTRTRTWTCYRSGRNMSAWWWASCRWPAVLAQYAKVHERVQIFRKVRHRDAVFDERTLSRPASCNRWAG